MKDIDPLHTFLLTVAAIVIAVITSLSSAKKIDEEAVKAGLQQCQVSNAIIWQKECK